MNRGWRRWVPAALAFLLLTGGLSAQEMVEEKGVVKELEETYQEHTVVKGDTLWDLAEKYLADPWKWPQIWEINPFVKDPHWIYPGQVLKIRITAEAKRKVPMLGGPTAIPMPPPTGPVAPILLPQANLAFQLNLKSNMIDFLSPDKLASSGKFIEAFKESYMLADPDQVYFSYKGEGAVSIGDQFTLFRISHKVKHPAKRGSVGWLIDVVGEMEVVDVGKDKKGNPVYTGKLTDATSDINITDRILPWESRPVKVVVNPATKEMRGYIVEAVDTQIAFGDNTEVFLDIGTEQGVEVGNTFLVYRDAFNKKKAPPYVIGRVIVVKTMAKTSTAMTTDSRIEIRPGDMIVSEVAK